MRDSYSQERLLEIGELVLAEMGGSKSGALTVGSFIQQVRGEAEDDLYSKDVKALLEREGLIERSNNVAGKSVITSYGTAVWRNGGLLWLIEERRKKEELEDDLKRTAIAANEQSAQWNAWALKTRFWPHLIALASLLVALLALLKSFGWI